MPPHARRAIVALPFPLSRTASWFARSVLFLLSLSLFLLLFFRMSSSLLLLECKVNIGNGKAARPQRACAAIAAGGGGSKSSRRCCRRPSCDSVDSATARSGSSDDAVPATTTRVTPQRKVASAGSAAAAGDRPTARAREGAAPRGQAAHDAGGVAEGRGGNELSALYAGRAQRRRIAQRQEHNQRLREHVRGQVQKLQHGQVSHEGEQMAQTGGRGSHS